MRCWGRFPVEEALDVEGDVSKVDLCLGPVDDDGADRQTHAVLLSREHVLDGGTDLGSGGVGALQGCTLCGTEYLEVSQRLQLLQRILRRRQHHR